MPHRVDRSLFRRAEDARALSDDAENMVGCVLVSIEGRVIAEAGNTLPPGVEARHERRTRPGKYAWINHAEANAISIAARDGRATKGALAIVTHHPCRDCAGYLIAAGIVCVFAGPGRFSTDETEVPIAAAKLDEAGVPVIRYHEEEIADVA